MRNLSKKELKQRVDIQASILTAAITLISSLSVFLLCYGVTYSDTIQSLTDRVNAIYEKVAEDLNPATFQAISKPEDTNSISYMQGKAILSILRETTGATSIFTLKLNEKGEVVYVIDSAGMTEEEFHYPNEKIEESFEAAARASLEGEGVVSTKMLKNQGRKVVYGFYPEMYNDQIVGTIGIVFEVQNQYDTYRTLAWGIPIVCIICCLLAVAISFHVFRRISNPSYKDVYNTDLQTKMKSRNAFEIDMSNLHNTQNYKNMGILSIDLNNLKKINDSMGHTVGDDYIKAAARILQKSLIQKALLKEVVTYRIGGDEFAVLVQDCTPEKIDDIIDGIHHQMEQCDTEKEIRASFAIGHAIYEEALDTDFFDTYKRADVLMYKDKKRCKENENS